MSVTTEQQTKLTRFGKYLEDHKLKPNLVAEVAGVSRQHVYRLRLGQAEPTRPVMIWLTLACRQLLRRRAVRITELFDLGDGER